MLLLLIIAVHANALAIAQIRYALLIVYSIGAFGWLILLARSRRPLKIPLITAPLAIIIAYQFILIPVSPLPFHGFEIALLSIFFLLLFIFFLDSLHHGWEIRTWENALISTAILFSLVDILVISRWLGDWKSFSGSNWSLPPFGLRTGGSFLAHPNFMAMYINLSLPLIIIRLHLAEDRLRKVAWGFLILFFVGIEYFASSRGGWLSAIAGISMMILLLNLKSFSGRFSLLERLKGLITTKTFIRLGGIIALGAVIGDIFLRQVQGTPGHGPVGSGRFGIWNNAFNIFLDSPIWGNGTYSMRALYAAEAGLPPGFFAASAHNAVLQIAGEYGLIGLALVGWLVYLLLRSFIRTWRSAPETLHPRLAGYAAIFTALAVHHIFDYAFEPELLPITVGVLLLLALLSHQAPETERLNLQIGKVVPAIVGLLLIFSLGTAFSLKGSNQFQQGINAADEGDWVSAQDQICAAYETSPYISHYAFQCGLAQAQVAYQNNDRQALKTAVSSFKEGLSIDPFWPINWANLAILEWEIGERSDAVEHMRQAAASAPRNAILALNLGWMMEQLGEAQVASELYQFALELEPRLEETIFFMGTNLRMRALADYFPAVIETSANSLARAGWRALGGDNLLQAEEYAQTALSVDAINVNAYALLARLNLLRGDLENADEMIKLALFLYDDSPIVQLEASRIARAMGDEQAAMNHLLRAYELLRDADQSFDYTKVLYMRPVLPTEFVPQLIHPRLSTAVVQEFEDLAIYMKGEGKSKIALRLEEWIAIEAR